MPTFSKKQLLNKIKKKLNKILLNSNCLDIWQDLQFN